MPVPTPSNSPISVSPYTGLLDTLANSFIKHLEQQAQYAPNTLQAYASDLRCFLEALAEQLGRSPILDDFQPEMLEAYFEREAGHGQSRNTLARRKATLKKFHRYLLQAGHKPADFSLGALEAIELPGSSSGKTSTTIQPLTAPEIARLLDHMESARLPRARRDQALLMLVVELGLPVNRLVSLDLVDVDLQAGLLRPRADNSAEVSLGAAGDYLARYVTQGRPDLNPNPDDPALFISQFGGRLSRQGIWQILEHWGQVGGFDGQVSPRSLRYTAAARMLQAGRSLEEIHLLLGHSNLLSTQAFLRRLSQALPEMAVTPGLLFQAQPAETAEPTRH